MVYGHDLQSCVIIMRGIATIDPKRISAIIDTWLDLKLGGCASPEPEIGVDDKLECLKTRTTDRKYEFQL